MPESIDKWTGYRFYETKQLERAAKIKSYRQLDLSIDEIKSIFDGANVRNILGEKAKELQERKESIIFWRMKK